jgi:hypothetical protein
MYESFAEDREVTDDDILRSLRSSVPLSVTRREDIERLRLWARERARAASTEQQNPGDPIGRSGRGPWPAKR